MRQGHRLLHFQFSIFEQRGEYLSGAECSIADSSDIPAEEKNDTDPVSDKRGDEFRIAQNLSSSYTRPANRRAGSFISGDMHFSPTPSRAASAASLPLGAEASNLPQRKLVFGHVRIFNL